MINYSLKNNPLTNEPDDYRAQVEITRSVDIDDIAHRMLKLGSTVTLADIRAVLTNLSDVCQEFVLEGSRVNLGDLVDIYPRVRGRFTGLSDEFSSLRHNVGATANVSRRFLDAVRKSASVQKLDPTYTRPEPLEFVDVRENSTNTGYSVGGIGKLTGKLLSFNPEAADEGIFFVNPADPADKVRVEEVSQNEPKQLQFLIPAGVGGQRILQVFARIRGGEELRKGELPFVLGEI